MSSRLSHVFIIDYGKVIKLTLTKGQSRKMDIPLSYKMCDDSCFKQMLCCPQMVQQSKHSVQGYRGILKTISCRVCIENC